MFSISVTGHVDAAEHSREAVARKLQEELGLDPQHVQIEFLFSLRQDAQLRPTYIDRQINDVYVGWVDFKLKDIVLTKKLFSAASLVPFAAFEAMVK
jgi:8-oxo-dGTP pyrophosphatase MutT (NUDIX family)